MTHKQCDYPTPAAWARIRAALDAIVQRVKAEDAEKEKGAEHATR